VVGQNVAKNVRLTERDITILRDHVARFRMTTTVTVHRLHFEPQGCDVDATKSWLRRMKDGGYLAAADLYGESNRKVKYFHLTDEGAGQVAYGETRIPSGHVSPGRLSEAFGVLSFCCLGPRVYRKLTPQELEQRLTTLFEGNNLPREPYYLDDDHADEVDAPENKLGYIYVDKGGSTPYWRVVERYHRLVAQRRAFRPWRDYFDKGRFIVTIVTATAGKKKQIDDALQQKPNPVPFRVDVRPELVHLRPPHKRHAAKRRTNT
jgi:hypothetical protein